MSHDMVMPLIVGQEWRRRISRMQWLLNAVLAVECLSMPFFAAGAVAGMVWYGGRRMGADWGWLAGGALAAAGLFLAVWGWLRLRGRFFSRRDTAAFLDEQLGLHAALSAGEEWGNAVEVGESAVQGNSVLRIRSCLVPGLAGGRRGSYGLRGFFAVARAASRRAASGFAARSGPGGGSPGPPGGDGERG